MQQFLRHGNMVSAEEDRKSLVESGLTEDQQRKWQYAQEVIGEDKDPEITYENVPFVEKIAQDILEQLPKKALILFVSTSYSRTRMTAALLSQEIGSLAGKDNKKIIYTGSIWEPEEMNDLFGSLSGADPEFIQMWKEYENSSEAQTDPLLKDYSEQINEEKIDSNGQEILFSVVEKDLLNQNSIFRKRAEELRKQIDAFKKLYVEEELPMFFFGVGHVTTLIALDIALSGRESYSSADELPKPLTLWKID